MELPDGEYIPEPLLVPAVHRLALLAGLQGRLVGGAVIDVGALSAALTLGLRDLRLIREDGNDWLRWDPVMRFATAGVELALETLAVRVGAARHRVATPAGSARFVVEWLNAPSRRYAEAHGSLRQRAEERSRQLAAVPAAAHDALAREVLVVSARFADLARWLAGRGSVPVLSSSGQIGSWAAAVTQADTIQRGLATVAALLAAEVEKHGDV